MAENGKYTRFDAADYLEDLDDVATYLEIALQESAEDPTAIPRALGVIARSQNMSELARRVGMSRDGLYKALSADGNPTWSTILKVTNALGLRFELHTVAWPREGGDQRGSKEATGHRLVTNAYATGASEGTQWNFVSTERTVWTL